MALPRVAARAFWRVPRPLHVLVHAFRPWPALRGTHVATWPIHLRVHSVVVSDDNVVYASDVLNNRIHVFAANGAKIGTWGSPGREKGQFRFPRGLALTKQGEVLVADADNHRIQVFGKDGSFVRTWGSRGDGDGQFQWPREIVVSHDGTAFVTDLKNHVQVFRVSDGTFLRKWTSKEFAHGEFNTIAACVTKTGEVRVLDTTSCHFTGR